MDVDRVSRAVVDRAIDQASARVRTVSALSGALLIAAGAIAYVAFAVFADHFLSGGLSLTARRAGLACAGALVVIFTMTRVVRPAFRHINQLYSAWLLERAKPDLRHAVTTSLLLRGRSDVHVGVSSGLAFQAARAVRRIDVTGVVSDSSLRRAGLAVGIVIACFGVYGLLAPKQVRPSVMRVLGANVPVPTQTSVEIIAPAHDVSVVVGTPVAFEAAISGRAPESAWVEFSPDEGRTWPPGRRLDLKPPLERTASDLVWAATCAGADVAATVWYRVHAGDARCDVRRIEVRPQPVVTRHSVEVTWPEYAGRSDSTRTDGPIDTLVGARAELTVRTNVPASDGRVIFHAASGDFSRQMTIEGDDRRTLRGAWVVDRDLEYEVRFNDMHGASNADPIRYTQRARGDKPPEIAQSEPPPSFTAAPTDVFNVRARVTDDWGLARVALAYRGTRGSGLIDLVEKSADARTIVDVDTTIPVESLRGVPGDVIELYLEATDARVNLRGVAEPQVTRGPVSELRIVGGKSGGSADPSRKGDRQGGGGPNGGGNQAAKKGNAPNGTDAPGTAGGQPGEKRSGAADKPDPSATAKGDGATDEADGSKTKSESNQSAESSEPGNVSTQGNAKPGDATGKTGGTSTDTDGPAKPSNNVNSNDVATPGSTDRPADANEKGTNGKAPGDEASPGGEPGNAEAQLDRLIGQNKDAVERLSRGDEKTPGEPNDGTERGSSDSPLSKDSGEKNDNPGNSTESKGGAGEKDRPSKPSTDAGKPGSSGGAKEQPSGKSATPSANKGDEADAKAAEGGQPTEKPGGQAGEANERAEDSARPGDGNPGANVKPGEGEPKPAGSDDKAESGGFAKDPDKEVPKDAPANASTPRPADKVGPTPKTGGGVVEDAGAGNPDGQFEGGKGDEPLGAPMRERARRAVDELERRLRDGGIGDAELRDLGWSRAEARTFVTRYRRLQKAAQEQRDGGLFSGRVREGGDADKSTNGDSASGVGRGMAGAVRGDSNAAKDARHAGEAPPESVPPELQDVLDEYYRSMARQGGTRAESNK